MNRSIAYHRADSVEGAVDLLSRLGDEAKVVAGGQSLVVMMNLELVRPAALVDIDRLADHAYLRREGVGLRVGALTRHAQVEHYEGDLGGFDILKRAARHIAFPAIRARGTFGGVLAHGDPTGEFCVLSVLLDAEIVVQGVRGRRIIPAAAFFQGYFENALEPDEIIVEVRFPRPMERSELCEFDPHHPDLLPVIAAVGLDFSRGAIQRARIALGGVGPVPVRMGDAEDGLEGAQSTQEAAVEAAAAVSRALARATGNEAERYRCNVAGALVRRSLSAAFAGPSQA